MLMKAQSEKLRVINRFTVLSTTKTSIKLETSDSTLARMIIEEDKEKSKLSRYYVTFKVDRLGRYPEYDFSFKNDEAIYVNDLIQRMSKVFAPKVDTSKLKH